MLYFVQELKTRIISLKFKKKKMENQSKEKTTNLWVVLNEETLEVQKNHFRNTDNVGNEIKGVFETAKFKTQAEADEWASQRLEMWLCVNVHFNHKWIEHSTNFDKMELFDKLEETFENLGSAKRWPLLPNNGTNNGKCFIFAIWLDDNDSKREPTTARGMMKRLNILDEFKFLLSDKRVNLVVDDRALIVNMNI